MGDLKVPLDYVSDTDFGLKLDFSSQSGYHHDSASPSNYTDKEIQCLSMDNRQDVAKKLACLSHISKKQKQRFANFFPEVAKHDAAIKAFHCALVTDILYQGFLYITPNWFCFYSNVFGKRRMQIPLKAVVDISKKRTAMFIPNAVGVTTSSKEYVFGSLISRENTYKVMKKVWLLWQTISYCVTKDSVCIDANMETCSIMSQVNGSIMEASINESISTSGHESDCEFVDALTFSDAYLCDATCIEDGHHKNQLYLTKNFFLNGFLFNCMLEIYRLPRTCLFLSIACILTTFLLISAVTFTLHLSSLQDTLISTCDASSLHHLNFGNRQAHQTNFESLNDLHSLLGQLFVKMDGTLAELLKLTQHLTNQNQLKHC